MKIILSTIALPLCLLSCTQVHEFKAGGASFDDSELARKLDANAPLPQDLNQGGGSFQEWRERE